MTRQDEVNELMNNYERAVFLKGDPVYPRESARYFWAKDNLLGKKVLEIGCSNGYGRQFLPKDIEYTGLDYDPKIIENAKAQQWEGINKFVNGDINTYPLEQYDTIIAFEVIEHLDNGLEIAKKLKKHCKRLLITCPWNEPKGFWGEHHKLHGINESHFQGFDIYYFDQHGGFSNYPKPINESNHFNLMIAKWDKAEQRKEILCSVATRGRYTTTLPMVLMAIANQTKSPDKLVIFDDNDNPEDMRENPIYQHIFQILDYKGIKWEWLFADKKGQHHIHQKANEMGYKWVWRVDDDAIPEPNVLQNLHSYATEIKNVGAVGGSILTMPNVFDTSESTGKIADIDKEPNVQWGNINVTKQVEHLHCSFLYRAGVNDYNLGLSRVAHREETLFTYGLYKKGYKVLVAPHATTWHLKAGGGIRSESREDMYAHDEQIFRNIVQFAASNIVVLNCGAGDHIVFSHVLPDIPNPAVFTCYPEIVPGRSIAEAKALFGDLDRWNIYKKMAQWNWKGSLEDAYRKLYL
jgi:SAM-dependent methyltransferase